MEGKKKRIKKGQGRFGGVPDERKKGKEIITEQHRHTGDGPPIYPRKRTQSIGPKI